MLRIKETRMERHISQKELAKVLGIGVSSLSQYENGQRQPGYDTILKIADLFGVSTDYLLGRSSSKDPPATHAESSVSADEIQLLRYYRDFNADGKTQLTDFARTMKRSGLYKVGTDYFVKGFDTDE